MAAPSWAEVLSSRNPGEPFLRVMSKLAASDNVANTAPRLDSLVARDGWFNISARRLDASAASQRLTASAFGLGID